MHRSWYAALIFAGVFVVAGLTGAIVKDLPPFASSPEASEEPVPVDEDLDPFVMIAMATIEDDPDQAYAPMVLNPLLATMDQDAIQEDQGQTVTMFVNLERPYANEDIQHGDPFALIVTDGPVNETIQPLTNEREEEQNNQTKSLITKLKQEMPTRDPYKATPEQTQEGPPLLLVDELRPPTPTSLTFREVPLGEGFGYGLILMDHAYPFDPIGEKPPEPHGPP